MPQSIYIVVLHTEFLSLLFSHLLYYCTIVLLNIPHAREVASSRECSHLGVLPLFSLYYNMHPPLYHFSTCLHNNKAHAIIHITLGTFNLYSGVFRSISVTFIFCCCHHRSCQTYLTDCHSCMCLVKTAVVNLTQSCLFENHLFHSCPVLLFAPRLVPFC